jgi:aryl-alcohol dehydrogenase-like predicted oxidoreductase
LSRKHLIEACHEALGRLQTDYLDLFFCHRPDPNTPIEEVVWTMNDLIHQGKVLYWGTSMWSAAEIMEAHRVASQHHLIGPSMEQPQYNMFERQRLELDYLPIFNGVGLGTTIWSPLASGILTGKYNSGVPGESRMAIKGFEWLKDRWLDEEKLQKTRKLAELAQELNIPMSAMAIAWCIKNPHVTTAILGATRKEQLLENLKSLECIDLLTNTIIDRIEGILQNKPKLETI